jgi:hypothetical protein
MDQCWPSLGFHLSACITTSLGGNGLVLKSNPMVLHGPRSILESNLVGFKGFFCKVQLIGLGMDMFTIVIFNYYKLTIITIII